MKIIGTAILIALLISCANVVAPTGGDKDINPPKLLNIKIIDNLKNVNQNTIKFEFDEYIQLNKWEEYFYISPYIKKTPQKEIRGKNLFILIEDTLNYNTNYYMALNSCIKDNNEGNVLDTLGYIFSTNYSCDTLSFIGSLKDAYTLIPLENTWVMLFNKSVNDSLIFKDSPHYIAKTNKNGIFHFPNLRDSLYKIAAITGIDFCYNEEEKIAFSDNIINIRKDSFISLFAFDPIIKIDSTISDSLFLAPLEPDDSSLAKSIVIEENALGNLEIITNKKEACIFQLLQNDRVIGNFFFPAPPYLIKGITAGKYQLKYIVDNNQDSIWNTGNWSERVQPEKVLNYISEISIRSNWDLELEWIISK